MPGRRRAGTGRPGWVRRLKWLCGGRIARHGELCRQSTCAEWNDLAYFVLISRLALDGRVNEPARIVCEERILSDARRLAAMGFFELFAVRSVPLRAMLEGEGVIRQE